MGETPFPRSRWRRAAFGFAVAAFLTFGVNLGFILWATIHRRDTLKDGIGTVTEQTCSGTKRLNTLIHVVINILSTILLAGSNYCMQCLIAPTRSEIDDAHKRQYWLDIGVPSVRNFTCISGRRQLLWILLSISSFPLHLLYNSVIFTSTSTNVYSAFVVNERWLEETNRTAVPDYMRTPNMANMYNGYKAGKLQELSVAECIDDYGVAFQSTRGNVLLLSVNADFPTHPNDYNATMALYGGLTQTFDWMCNDQGRTGRCDDILPSLKQTPDQWTPRHNNIQKCYSQKTDEHCKLLFSSGLCWVVTVLNLLKGVLMLFVAFGGDAKEKPILTVGDAVASFFQDPDETTKMMCLKSKRDFRRKDWGNVARQFDPRPLRKFAAASRKRWVTCVTLYVLSLIVSFGLLIWGLNVIEGDKDIGKLGLGAMNAKTIIESSLEGQGSKHLVQNAVLANTPQVIMSFLYFTYNALYTSISLVTEWDRFAHEEKGLRVTTTPRGAQRETYFLQLPYRYSLPLLVFSGGLHWLISQSIFLVNLEVYAPSVDDIFTMVSAADLPRDSPWSFLETSFTTCGWSPIGIVCVIIAGLAMIGFLLVSGVRNLRFGGIPVAGSCSAAISAACDPGQDEKEAWEKPLRWGVMPIPTSEPRHCAFSSEPVEVPMKGQVYA